MFCGFARAWPKNAWAAWECKAETTTGDGRLTSCTFHDDLVDLLKIGIGGGCLSLRVIQVPLLCQINMLTEGLGQCLRQIVLQVLFVLYAYREPHGAFAHQGLRALLRGVVAAMQ
jgi:hypothetical protein